MGVLERVDEHPLTKILTKPKNAILKALPAVDNSHILFYFAP